MLDVGSSYLRAWQKVAFCLVPFAFFFIPFCLSLCASQKGRGIGYRNVPIFAIQLPDGQYYRASDIRFLTAGQLFCTERFSLCRYNAQRISDF